MYLGVGTAYGGDVYSLPSLSVIANIPASEMSALYDLYNATNGESWHWSNSPTEGIPWNFSNNSAPNNNPCVDHWQGISCSFSTPFEFYHVTGIVLPSYNLIGTLPYSVSGLSQLQDLELDSNLLSGTIPESLGNLTQLQYMYLYLNGLTGTIPESLGNLTQLQDLDLDENFLSGTIPGSLGKLMQLKYMYLYLNQLSGSIPESLGDLMQLQRLALSTNYLNGTIPASLGNLIQLQYVYLYSNELAGSIPESLGNLAQLRWLMLNTNQLTGSIPESLGSPLQISYLYLYHNQLTGTIPESLGNLLQLQDLELDTNNLNGTIPASLGNPVRLAYLFIYSNQLSGTIPNSLSNLMQLQDIRLDTNKLTGTIPNSLLGNLARLQYVSLDTNRLTGTIPHIVSESLQELLLSDNQLHGRVPSLSHVSSLRVVLMQNNRLSGTLDHVFSPATQLIVETIVIANNQLTGTLPQEIFQLKLQDFVATSNCFEGQLPITAICNNSAMISFVVDGISSASSCRNKLFVGSLSAYTLEHDIGGSLPACLFQLPNIVTLHLSGIGLTGSILRDIGLSSTLRDLSLSHNALTGRIPSQIQQKKWSNIDLSYNRLSGTLSSNFASNESVELENNRISGTIPTSFRALTNISVLGSNTFSCRYDEHDLPNNDPNREQYHCGSNSFDILFFIWLGAFVCTIVLLGYYEQKHNTIRSIFSRDVILHDTNLYITLAQVCRLSLMCTLYSIVVLLPVYAVCSVSYSTQTYAYAYQISAVYMSGVVPFALNWCFWWIMLICVKTFLLYAPTIVNNAKSIVKKKIKRSLWQTMVIFAPYLFVDVIVVAGVNAAYVYVAVYQSSSLLLVVQALLSIFKVVWSRWALPYILTVSTGRKESGKLQVFTQIVVNLLNNIAIPCLIVVVVSPNCFYNALISAPVVTSIIHYRECTLISAANECTQYTDVPLPTSFEPPFTYNYQCSSSLITYYSPAFVSMCIVSTFVTPLSQYMCQWLHRRATVGSFWHRFLDRCLPRLAKPIKLEDAAGVSDRISYLNIGGLMTTLIGLLGLMLTFGVMFPPLCAALAVSICATVLTFRDNVSKCIGNASQQHYDKFEEIIKVECNSVDAMRILKGSVWLLITVACWFYTLFLFDILGDAVGFKRAYWVLIVMPLMPLVLYVLYTAVCNRNCSPPFKKMGGNEEVEMPTINILLVGIPAKSESQEKV